MLQVALQSHETQVLTVFLNGQMFGIPIPHIQDILRTQQLTRIPLAPHAVEGIMNLRGRIVTAVNLSKRLDVENNNASGQTMSVVIEHEGELFSLIVDRVGDVLNLACDKIEDAPLTLNPTWRDASSGVFQLENKIMVLLNPDALFQIYGGNK